MKKSLHQPKRKSTAQAMVEFALALPVLLLVVYGLIESGRLLFIYASVVTAARTAARYGSATGDNGSNTPYYNDCTGIEAAARRLQFIQLFSAVTVKYDKGPNTTDLGTGCPITTAGHPMNGDRIRVTVSALFKPIVPLVPFGPITITSTSNRTLLVGASIAVTNPAQGFTGGAVGLALGKHATQDTFTALGEQITYIYTLQNTGTSPVVGPWHIHDDKIIPHDFLCAGIPATLDPASAVFTCSNPQVYIITLDDLKSPELQNHAVASNGDGSIISNQAVYTITFLANPHITLAKSGTPPDIIATGQPVSYQFTILNDGNTPLGPPYTISDPKVSNALCPSAPTVLPMGGTVVCTGTYALKNADITSGEVSNTATASAKYGQTTVTSGPASAIVLTPPLELTLTVSPQAVSTVGTVVTYTYSLKNRTTGSMKSITVTDTRGANKLACVATLAAGTTASCTHTYTVVQADIDTPSGSFSNLATANGQGNVNSNQAGVNVDVTAAQAPQITLTKTANPSSPAGNQFSAGQLITYTYKITNVGNVTLTASATTPFTVTDDKLGSVCSITSGSMAPGGVGSQTCTMTYTLQPADIAAGLITNTGSATAHFGSKTVTASGSATVITFKPARLTLVKTANPPYFSAAGETIAYTYTLKNTSGIVTLSAPYSVTDNKLTGIDCTAAVSPLLPGNSTTCTKSYLVLPADFTAGSITNIASATAMNGGAPLTSASVTLTVPKAGAPTGGCTFMNVTHGPLTISGSTMSMTIHNLTDSALVTTTITVYWNSSTGANGNTPLTLTGASLGTSSRSLNFPTSPQTIPNWQPLVPIGDSTISFTFDSAYVNSNSLNTAIYIDLSNNVGCSGFVLSSGG